jgi:hypothetical protein
MFIKKGHGLRKVEKHWSSRSNGSIVSRNTAFSYQTRCGMCTVTRDIRAQKQE